MGSMRDLPARVLEKHLPDRHGNGLYTQSATMRYAMKCPLFPPDFSSSRVGPSVIARSTALHMS